MGPAPERTGRRQHFSMLRSFHLADFFTLANGSCGTAAIFFAMAHMREAMTARLYAAGALIGLALVFDVVDGRVARWRHRDSPLGRELDSLADVISFGVAPASSSDGSGERDQVLGVCQRDHQESGIGGAILLNIPVMLGLSVGGFFILVLVCG